MTIQIRNIISILLISSVLSLTPLAESFGFTTELIHRDSPDSPLYNISAAAMDRVRAAARRSVGRARIITNKILALSGRPVLTDFNSPLLADPHGGEFLMSFSIGSPATKLITIADTGSDLIWTTCKPCTGCHSQNLPVFDPESSSTYRQVSCNTKACNSLVTGSGSGCGSGSSCQYSYGYGDGSNIMGVLGTETLTFSTSNQLPKVIFGCTHEETAGSAGSFSPSTSGLVGLGGSGLSLVAQLGIKIDNRFSYCLTSINSKANSHINFGSNAVVTGANVVKTPLVPGSNDIFYWISLQQITVGDTVISYPGESTGNTIIDSGTTLTLLDSDFLNGIIQAVDEIVNLPQTSVDGLSLCYDISGVSQSELNLPDLTFQFDGAPVKVSAENAFLVVEDNVVCLSLVSAGQTEAGVQIFGNVNQQNYHIGYDLGAKELSFAKVDCTKF